MAAIVTTIYEGTDANERFLVPGDLQVFVEGRGGNDYILGTAGGDTLLGGPGDDVILGGLGNDTIYGDDFPTNPGGRDQILAGGGDDVVYGGGGRDYINGEGGDDELSGDRHGDFLVGGLGWDVIRGGFGRDVMFGNSVVPDQVLPLLLRILVDVDGITGLPIAPPEQYGGELGPLPIADDNATDMLYGGWGRDIAFGQGGADYLYGGQGRDYLAGGPGQDCLTGGPGNDRFAFAEFGKKNWDCIEDFHRGDRILLDVTVFKGLGRADHTLKAKFFHVGGKPADKDDRIIYDQNSGRLFYDRDGSGGKFGMKKFAELETSPNLKASDIDLI